MSLATQTRPMTAEELFALPETGVRRELLAGEVREMAPAGGEHGRLGQRLSVLLSGYVMEHGLGESFLAETGFVLSRDPDTVRAPDGAVILKERLPEPMPTGFVETIPDLVLEVASPSETHEAVMAKVGQWLDAGVKVVWVIWPEPRRLWVCRPGGDAQVLGPDDTLTCPDLVPGFEAPLCKVFG